VIKNQIDRNMTKEEFLRLNHEQKLNFVAGENNKKTELNTSSIDEENTNEYEQIEELRKRIAETKREINRVETETARTKATFNQIAEHCKVEWFKPSWIERPSANKLTEINYWLR